MCILQTSDKKKKDKKAASDDEDDADASTPEESEEEEDDDESDDGSDWIMDRITPRSIWAVHFVFVFLGIIFIVSIIIIVSHIVEWKQKKIRIPHMITTRNCHGKLICTIRYSAFVSFFFTVSVICFKISRYHIPIVDRHEIKTLI